MFNLIIDPAALLLTRQRARPGRTAEIRDLTSHPRNYEWLVGVDIAACFDTIDHTTRWTECDDALGTNAVLALIKVFPKSGILTRSRRQ